MAFDDRLNQHDQIEGFAKPLEAVAEAWVGLYAHPMASTGETFLISSWRDAEFFACGHMQTLGFLDAEVTKEGADGGLDVIASGAGAQVKHFTSGPVGSPTVQRLMGAAAGEEHRLFYSLAGYSGAALRLGEERDVALFQYDLQGEVTAASSSAETLIESGFATWSSAVTDDRAEFITSLQQFVQRVGDSAVHVVENMMGPTPQIYEELLARDRDEAREFLAVVRRESSRLAAILVPLNGSHEYVLVDVLKKALEAENLAVQLAARLGMDYSAIALDRRAERDARPQY